MPLPTARAWRIEIVLTERDRLDAEYLLPIWNARLSACRVSRRDDLERMMSELAQTALGHYTQRSRASEGATLATLFAAATPEARATVRDALGLVAAKLPEGMDIDAAS